MIIFAHSKCKRYENRKIQGVALPKKERIGQEWKSSHHGTHHSEQDYGAVLLQVVLHSIALESSCQPIGGQEQGSRGNQQGHRAVVAFHPKGFRCACGKENGPDFIKMLSTPMADERTELARRCFIFASLTSLSYIDVKKLYPHHISENSEGRKFIRKEREKTGVEFFVPLHPIAEKILSLYNTTDDSKPVFPLGEKKNIYLDVHTLGMVLGISNKLGFHASRHTFGVLMLNEDIPIGSIAKMMGHADITSTQVYAQVTEQKISNDMDKLIAKRERNRLSNEKTIGK